ncbi:MAG TPA: hypothetical protein VIC62_09125 [Nakamurella sp.]
MPTSHTPSPTASITPQVTLPVTPPITPPITQPLSTTPSGRPASRRPWHILGTLIITDVVLTFLGAGLDHGAPTLGAGQQEVVDHFVGVPVGTEIAGGFIEFVGVLVFLGWALLLARLLRRGGRGGGELTGWLSAAIAATAIIDCALVLGSLAVEVAATYDGHQGAGWQLLGVVNDGADVAYFASLGVRGVFLGCVAVAGLVTRALPAWLCWLGVVLGVAGFVSPLGAAAGAHQLVFLAGTIWSIALAVVALTRRRPAEHPADSAAPALI